MRTACTALRTSSPLSQTCMLPPCKAFNLLALVKFKAGTIWLSELASWLAKRSPIMACSDQCSLLTLAIVLLGAVFSLVLANYSIQKQSWQAFDASLVTSKQIAGAAAQECTWVLNASSYIRVEDRPYRSIFNTDHPVLLVLALPLRTSAAGTVSLGSVVTAYATPCVDEFLSACSVHTGVSRRSLMVHHSHQAAAATSTTMHSASKYGPSVRVAQDTMSRVRDAGSGMMRGMVVLKHGIVIAPVPHTTQSGRAQAFPMRIELNLQFTGVCPPFDDESMMGTRQIFASVTTLNGL